MALFLAVVSIVAIRILPSNYVMGDYRAFYCGARVTLERSNLYDATPLAACESSPTHKPLFHTPSGEVLPAPIPGYLVAALLPFAALPFEWSALLWAVVLVASGIASLVLLRRLRVGSFPVLLVAFSVPLFGISLPVGELPFFALLGVSIVAVALVENRPLLIVPGLALTMVEPQVGIALAAALCALRRSNWPIVVATFAGLAIVSLVTIGSAQNLQYVRDVLPAHLYAELPGVQQYSLSWIFDSLGATSAVSLAFGKLWYAMMLVAAIAVARTAQARRSPEFAVFAAAAFAVSLGPFVHLDHIVLALPAALWLASRAERAPLAIVASIVAFALPLLYIMATPVLILTVPLIAGWIATFYGRSSDVGLRCAGVATLIVVAVEILAVHTGTGLHAIANARTLPIAAQEQWAQYIRQHEVMSAWSIWIIKLPTWFAVAATLIACVSSRPRAQTAFAAASPKEERSNLY